MRIKPFLLALTLLSMSVLPTLFPSVRAGPAPDILGIEVTQAVQFFEDFGEVDRNAFTADNSLVRDDDGNPTFVMRKRTLVRVYIERMTPPDPHSHGPVTLRAFDAVGDPLSPAEIATPADFTPAENPFRSNRFQSANFLLLGDHAWVSEPIVQLEAEFENQVSDRITISFTERPILRLAMIRVKYCPGGDGDGLVEAADGTCYIEPLDNPLTAADERVHAAHVCPAADPCTGGNAAHTHPNLAQGHIMALRMYPFEDFEVTMLSGEIIYDQNLEPCCITYAGLRDKLEGYLFLFNLIRLLFSVLFGLDLPLYDRIHGWVPWRDVPDSFKATQNGYSGGGGGGIGDESQAVWSNANNDGRKVSRNAAGVVVIDPAPAGTGYPFGLWRRSLAHELAHSFDEVHNTLTLDEYGYNTQYDPNALILCIFGNPCETPLKSRNLNDIMYAGLRELQAWIEPTTYNTIWNYIDSPDNTLVSELLALQAQSTLQAQPTPKPGLIMSGMLDEQQDAFRLEPFWRVSVPDFHFPSTGNFAVEFLNATGALLLRVPFNPIHGTEDSECPTENPCPDGPPRFSMVSPLPERTSSIQFVRGTGPGAEVLNVIPVSDHSPEITILRPQPGTMLSDSEMVEWIVSDADGDPTACNVLYRTGTGKPFVPVAFNVGGEHFELDTTPRRRNRPSSSSPVLR